MPGSDILHVVRDLFPTKLGVEHRRYIIPQQVR